MKITFLGTRGYIDISTSRHKRHTITMITHKKKRILIDCGLDWLGHIDKLHPDAIFITHAHPDHAWGLQDGAPCPVYATAESWALMENYPIQNQILIKPRSPITVFGIKFEVFTVQHSIKAPGVGYRLTQGKTSIFCVHDLVYIHEQQEALEGVKLYIGDGATITRPMIRRHGDILFGHSPISTQLTWCERYRIPLAYFTHCGSQIVGTDGRVISPIVTRLGKQRGVDARIAYDGLSITIGA